MVPAMRQIVLVGKVGAHKPRRSARIHARRTDGRRRILGEIATTAIPLFATYRLRTRSIEVGTNLAAIRVAE